MKYVYVLLHNIMILMFSKNALKCAIISRGCLKRYLKYPLNNSTNLNEDKIIFICIKKTKSTQALFSCTAVVKTFSLIYE